jgi:hypothetical protein
MPEQTTPVIPARSTVRAIEQRTDRFRIVSFVIAVKVVLFVFGGQAYQVLEDKKLATLYEWLAIWHRWDAVHYTNLAEFGYVATGPNRPSIVFYPLLPWLMRVVSFVATDHVISSLMIATFASIVAAVLLYQLVLLDYSRDVALRSVWFLFIFPTSYFLHIGYTESLFLALVIGSFYCARTDRWMFAGTLGAFACMTRANGLVLIAALFAEAAFRYWKDRRIDPAWLWIAVVPLGFLVYVAVLYNAAGDPRTVMEIRREIFTISLAPPWVGVEAAVGQMERNPAQAQMLGMQEFVFILIGLAATIVSWFKLRPAYSVWITANWLLITSVTFIASVPRYTLTMFPIFILFAIVAKDVLRFGVISFWSLIYLAFFASQFAWGRWAF